MSGLLNSRAKTVFHILGWYPLNLHMLSSGLSIVVSDGFRYLIILFDILSCPGAFLVLRLSMILSISVVVMVSLCV